MSSFIFSGFCSYIAISGCVSLSQSSVDTVLELAVVDNPRFAIGILMLCDIFVEILAFPVWRSNRYFRLSVNVAARRSIQRRRLHSAQKHKLFKSQFFTNAANTATFWVRREQDRRRAVVVSFWVTCSRKLRTRVRYMTRIERQANMQQT